MAVQAAPAPKLSIPESQHTVDVSIIDTTARIQAPIAFFIKDPLPGHDFLRTLAHVFLIEHASGRKIIYDFSVRKDVDNFPPVVLEMLNSGKGFHADVPKDVAQVLQEDGRVKLEEIEAIIWSHAHLDHTGDPSTFPGTTELVVGPGFKAAFLPGYPADPKATINEKDVGGRNIREIEFKSGLELGRFKAFDYFGDGSFYLLDCPGHCPGHICGLARTTPSTFIFMGADTCHHGGCLRPTEYLPLPSTLTPSPFSNPPFLPHSICPGALLEDINPTHSLSKPFYSQLAFAPDRDLELAEEGIRKMAEFDANENVFVVIAHDDTLLDIVDFFPKRANDWKEKGWKEQVRWRFLADFLPAAKESKVFKE